MDDSVDISDLNGLDDADRAAIEFAFEDDWGDGGGESGAWVGVRGGCGGGWLSSLSAAAPPECAAKAERGVRTEMKGYARRCIN